MAAEDILSRPRLLPALIALRDLDPEPMTAGMLQRAVGYSPDAAVALRDDLAAWGLITVEEGLENRVRFVRMRLTPQGRAAADLAVQLQAAVRGARDAALR